MMSPTFRSTSTPFSSFRFRSRDALEQRNARAFRVANANARQILACRWLVLRFATLSGCSGRSAAAGPEVNSKPLLDRAVTVFARDLDRRARLVVEIAVAVRVLAEVAIDAVHARARMNVVEMHRLAELRRIVRRDDVAVGVEQVSLAIAFEDFAKHPAVTVKVCKLRVAQQRVERRRAGVFQKIEVGPQAAQAGAFRIAIESLLFVLTRIVLLRRVHLRPSLSLSHHVRPR